MAHLADATMRYYSFPIEKFEEDADGNLVVEGIVTDGSLDADKQIVDPDWSGQALEKWMNTGGNMRVMHSPHLLPGGRGLELQLDQENGHRLRALVVEPVTQKLVRNKVLTGFSIGIWQPVVQRGVPQAPGGYVRGGDIGEVSFVDRPSNGSSRFVLAKSISNGAGAPGEWTYGDIAPLIAEADAREAAALVKSHIPGHDDGDELEMGNAPEQPVTPQPGDINTDQDLPPMKGKKSKKNKVADGTDYIDLRKQFGVEAAQWVNAEPGNGIDTASTGSGTGWLVKMTTVDAWRRWDADGTDHGYSNPDPHAGYQTWLGKRQFDPGVGGGVDRDQIPAEDFVEPGRRKFPVVTPGDVQDAASLAGKSKLGLGEFQSRLRAIAERKGDEFVAQLPETYKSITLGQPLASGMVPFNLAGQQADGPVEAKRQRQRRRLTDDRDSLLSDSAVPDSNDEGEEDGKMLNDPDLDKAAAVACPRCGGEYAVGAKRCPDCGKKLTPRVEKAAAMNDCPRCGEHHEPDAKRCTSCGKKLTKAGGMSRVKLLKAGLPTMVGCPDCGASWDLTKAAPSECPGCGQPPFVVLHKAYGGGDDPAVLNKARFPHSWKHNWVWIGGGKNPYAKAKEHWVELRRGRKGRKAIKAQAKREGWSRATRRRELRLSGGGRPVSPRSIARDNAKRGGWTKGGHKVRARQGRHAGLSRKEAKDYASSPHSLEGWQAGGRHSTGDIIHRARNGMMDHETAHTILMERANVGRPGTATDPDDLRAYAREFAPKPPPAAKRAAKSVSRSAPRKAVPKAKAGRPKSAREVSDALIGLREAPGGGNREEVAAVLGHFSDDDLKNLIAEIEAMGNTGLYHKVPLRMIRRELTHRQESGKAWGTPDLSKRPDRHPGVQEYKHGWVRIAAVPELSHKRERHHYSPPQGGTGSRHVATLPGDGKKKKNGGYSPPQGSTGGRVVARLPKKVRRGDLNKVGPKGYIHGWIFVGAPGTEPHHTRHMGMGGRHGMEVHHPEHGHGVVTRVGRKTATVKHGDVSHSYEIGYTSGTTPGHFLQRGHPSLMTLEQKENTQIAAMHQLGADARARIRRIGPSKKELRRGVASPLDVQRRDWRRQLEEVDVSRAFEGIRNVKERRGERAALSEQMRVGRGAKPDKTAPGYAHFAGKPRSHWMNEARRAGVKVKPGSPAHEIAGAVEERDTRRALERHFAINPSGHPGMHGYPFSSDEARAAHIERRVAALRTAHTAATTPEALHRGESERVELLTGQREARAERAAAAQARRAARAAKPAGKPRKPPKGMDPADAQVQAQHLASMESRERAQEFLRGHTSQQLRDIAPHLGWSRPYGNRQNLLHGVVDFAVGHRLDSEALRQVVRDQPSLGEVIQGARRRTLQANAAERAARRTAGAGRAKGRGKTNPLKVVKRKKGNRQWFIPPEMLDPATHREPDGPQVHALEVDAGMPVEKGDRYGLIRMHDALCPAYSAEVVKAAYPALVNVTDAFDPGWFNHTVLKAARRGRTALAQVSGLYDIAVLLKTMSPALIADARHDMHAAFTSVNPHPVAHPGAGVQTPSPGQFNRPYLAAGHTPPAATATNAVPPAIGVPTADGFYHGSPTDNLDTRNTLARIAGIPGGSVASGASHTYYPNASRAATAASLAALHDHIAATLPGLCPMAPTPILVAPDMGAAHRPNQVAGTDAATSMPPRGLTKQLRRLEKKMNAQQVELDRLGAMPDPAHEPLRAVLTQPTTVPAERLSHIEKAAQAAQLQVAAARNDEIAFATLLAQSPDHHNRAMGEQALARLITTPAPTTP